MNDYHSRCATDDSRIGVALGEYQAGNVGVSRVEICSRERPAVSIVAQWLAGATEALLTIDAPLGWPASLARALGGHPVGAAVTDGLRGPCLITVVISDMAIAHSKLTAQGQISVPAKIRQKLGLGPGSVLEWDDSGDSVLVRRIGRYTSEEIHRSVFPTPPNTRTVAEMKEGVRRHIRRRRAVR